MKKRIKIANIGGSNSILKHSYTNLLNSNDEFVFTNRAIGATNSIYSLIQNLKFNLIADNDVLIFEYFVNDCNYDVQKINNVERIHKTIIEILRSCQEHKTKVLFLMIYNIEDYNKGTYEHLDSYHKYFDIIQKYGIPYIDTNNLLTSHSESSLENYYHDHTHLNELGMQILTKEITKKIRTEHLFPKHNIDEVGFDGLCLHKIPDHSDAKVTNFSNSLINVDFIKISEGILSIEFDKETSVLGIEYLCDENSGYIEVKNSHTSIQKNTLKKEKLIFDHGKAIAAIVTFNSKQFSPSTKYTIEIISRADLSREKLDRERVSYISKSESNDLKIISLLVTNNAKVVSCDLVDVGEN